MAEGPTKQGTEQPIAAAALTAEQLIGIAAVAVMVIRHGLTDRREDPHQIAQLMRLYAGLPQPLLFRELTDPEPTVTEPPARRPQDW